MNFGNNETNDISMHFGSITEVPAAVQETPAPVIAQESGDI